jgi:hypothetical protein
MKAAKKKKTTTKERRTTTLTNQWLGKKLYWFPTKKKNDIVRESCQQVIHIEESPFFRGVGLAKQKKKWASKRRIEIHFDPGPEHERKAEDWRKAENEQATECKWQINQPLDENIQNKTMFGIASSILSQREKKNAKLRCSCGRPTCLLFVLVTAFAPL